MKNPSRSPVSDIKSEFAWSWSRHEMFYQCPRKIYWQYYGSWGGWEQEAPQDAALSYRLKHIKSVAMLVGGTLHEVVRERLRLRPEAGGPVPAQQIQDEVERRVLKRLRESRNRDWERFGEPKHYALLFEDYYGRGIDEREQETALEFARECAAGFSASVYARRAFAVPKKRLRIIDPADFDEMKIAIDGVPVYAAPDLVVEDADGLLHIVDWKTGKTGKADVAQLAVYGLYAAEKVGAPLERVVAHLVYVRSGESEKYTNLREGVAEARRRISTYTEDVRSRLTDVENNVAGNIEFFPMTENRMLCRRCKFQEICGRIDPTPEAPDDEEEL
jgi:PD-(D/E)XK nuclease superfamily protein